MINIFIIAYRNFKRNLSRYKVLILTMVFAVAAMIIVFAALMGITRSVENKASRYFAGSISIQEHAYPAANSIISKPEPLVNYIHEELSVIEGYSLRSIYYAGNASIFFNGDYARQRRLLGVEWALESSFLSELNLVEGNVPADEDLLGIVISTATSDRLGCRVGDSILISLKTLKGQENTANLIIRAIFDESSFFGYAAYMDRKVLNSIIGAPEERINEIGLYLHNQADENKVLRKLQAFFKKNDMNSAFPGSREKRDLVLSKIEEPTIMVLNLDAQLAEIKDLVDSIGMVAILVITLFLLILIVGVSNTYSMIVYERTNEIGTLRAIGLQKGSAVLLFLAEAAFIAVSSLILGVFLGVGFLFIFNNLLDFNFAGFMSLFLENGRLPWYLPLNWLMGIFLAILAACLIGALKPALRASRLAPVDAMRQE